MYSLIKAEKKTAFFPFIWFEKKGNKKPKYSDLYHHNTLDFQSIAFRGRRSKSPQD